MAVSKKASQIIFPWFTFAILQGLGAALVIGFFISLFALLFGVSQFLDALIHRELGDAFTRLVQAFPDFCTDVLSGCAYGFLAGFFMGLLNAPISGRGGAWWSCFASFVLLNLLRPQLANFSNTINLTKPDLILFFVLTGHLGFIFRNTFLKAKAMPFEPLRPLQKWLRSSWLLRPPHKLQIAGILLPFALYGIASRW